ncbi:MAG TPA: glycosyltransferase [Terriglobales bacterium]|nr:glycosyltransferase [Terriglobales bacterium]
MSVPKVTIVMPVYNGERFITDALSSIERQDYKNYEVFISNNCSTDRTYEIATEFAKRIPMKIVSHPSFKTMIENFDYAFSQVSTEFFLFLCYDDYLNAPNALSRAVSILEKDSNISSVYCDLDYVNSKGVRLLRRKFGRAGLFTGDELGRASIYAARNMFGIPLMARTTALQRYRSDSRFTYVADVDFSWQLAQSGPIYHIEEALFANRFGDHNSTWPVLSQAAKQFKLLADKYHVELTKSQIFFLAVKAWLLTQEKRLFGYYAQCRSVFDR